MTTQSDPIVLAREPSFQLGDLRVDPAGCALERADGQGEAIEPRIMQVLVVLAQAPDRFVSREELVARCWDGRIVSDDAVHRVMSRIRALANGIGAGSFTIETRSKVGYRLTEHAAGATSPAGVEYVTPPLPETRLGRRALVAGGVACGVAALAGIAWLRHPSTAPAPAMPYGRLAFAVLPFTTADQSPEAGIYARGLSDALRVTLARNRGIDVIAAASSRTVAAREITAREMGRMLDADYLVEGQLTRSGARLDVALSLVDAATGLQLWNETVSDDAVADVEEAASAALVQQVAGMIPPDGPLAPVANRRRDPTAYAYVLQARALLDGVRAAQMRGQGDTALADGDRAERLAEQALAIDPRDAGALMIRAVLARNGWTTALAAKPFTTEQRTAQAVGYIRQALLSDPNDPVALTELGDYYRRFQFRWTEAENLFRRALAIDPSLDSAHWSYAYMLGTTGRAVEGLDHALTLRRLDPANPFRRLALPRLLYVCGRRDLMMRLYDREFAAAKDNLFLVRELYIIFLSEGDATAMRGLAARVRAGWQGRAATADEAALLARIDAAAEALSGRPAALVRLVDADLAKFDDPGALRVATPQGRARDDLPYLFALEYAHAGRTAAALDMLERALAAKSLYWPATLPYGVAEFPPAVREHPRFAALWRRDPGLMELVARRRKAVTTGQMAGVTPDGRRVAAAIPAPLAARVTAAMAQAISV